MAKKMADGIEKISQALTAGYQRMESSIVHGFEKVSSRCIDVLFAREGETTEQARQRLSGNKE